MSVQQVVKTFGELAAAAAERAAHSESNTTRVTVQVGHCSASAGAEQIAADLSNSLPGSGFLVTAGCDGACYQAPVVTVGANRHVRVTSDDVAEIVAGLGSENDQQGPELGPFFAPQTRIALDGCGVLDSEGIDDYIVAGGYAGLAEALRRSPEEAIEEVKASGLRGRGGAYFPAALKWEAARGVRAEHRYLVVNCEEGEPGIFKDRHLMEGVPHRIVEGAIIASYAAGVSRALVYVNAEANLSARRMETAIQLARELGLVGDNILGSGFDLDVEVRRGAGGYVCGEETTLLNTVEGHRREPRLRPPFPTEAGLWSMPTVINNAETLASVPYIMTKGASAFRAIGTDSDPGTKVVSVSGVVERPGIAEAPMGTTLGDIVNGIGGGPRAGDSIGLLGIGGPSSGVLPPSMLDTPIKGGALHEAGVMLGAGGIVALGENVGLLDVLRNLAAYNADESCGKCTPCREGTPRMVELVDRLAAGDGKTRDIGELEQLARVVNAASLCGLGQAAGNPVLSALHFFGDELALLTSDS